MSNTPFTAKRTRSQLALPDDILHVPERSPMKDARTALRHHTAGAVGRRRDDSRESDDELLLSPGTTSELRKDSRQHIILTHKRSASPPLGGEYASRSDAPSDGRASKRIKRDVDVDQDGQRRAENVTTFESRLHSAHSRSASQPIMGNPTYAQSALDQPTRTSPLPGKDRARSVPIFSSYAVPHIDLRNPPTSPRRACSRSPSKEREIKLRITSGPTQIAKLETIADDIGPDVYTDDPILAPSTGPPLALSASNTGRDADQEPLEGKREATHDRSARPPALVVRELPSTPATIQPLSLTFPLSPLTPLPPTPLPSRSVPNPKDRYMSLGWETDRDEGDKDDVMDVTSQELKPLPKLGTTMKSRLPRPSSMMNISVTSTPRPSLTLALDQQSTTVMGPPSAFPAAKQSLPSGVTKRIRVIAKPTSSTPSMPNAYDILMGPAHRGTAQPKGKAKEKISSTKAGSSSFVPVIASKQKSRDGDKQETAQPKISIKAKMRAKEKSKPKPKPTPALVDDDDAYSPPSRALSPKHVPKSDTLSTIAAEDIPVEAAITPDGDINMSPSVMHSHANAYQRATTPPRMDAPAVVAHATLAAAPPPQSDVAHTPSLSEASVVTAAEQSTNSGSPEASRAHGEPAFTDLDPKPSSRAGSKPPLVKKVHLTTTTDRVARRMSQRQREKRAELSNQALHKASATHRSTMRKKPLSSMATDLKDSRAEIASASAAQDPDASISSIPDAGTDPMPEELVPPGSPMKLDSSVDKVSDVPEGTIASSTQLSPAKTVLPKTPSKPRLPSKPSPSPTKLVRSASMHSARPSARSGGLARTLTEFQGSSSLSTLANALEKLRMPPPERPNTSMGFHRELDTGHDLELTRYSTDDSFAGGHVLESTGTASVESDYRGSREADASGKSRMLHPEQKSSSLFKRERVGTTRLQSGSGLIMRGGKSAGSLQHKPRIIGLAAFGSGRVPKASRKTSLPSVMASPVKGDGAVEDAEMVSTDMDVAPDSHADTSSVVSLATNVGKGESSRKSPSRRVSLASQALSQSLSSLPSKQTQLMGLPTTPPNRRPGLRSSSSGYPCSSSSASDTAMLGSAPIAHGKVKSGVGGHISGNFTGHATASSDMTSDSLKILQDCVIFVDIRTDDGDEAASLFVEMLEGVGAKILTRVGQTCTHIVYKNGLMSTLTRYRLLRDPKPLVVGIAWVVECVEQRKRVDESKFIVDLEGVNVAGTNKRRRSMLPKLIRREAEGISSSDADQDQQVTECDQSMDGSSSLMTIDEMLTPLELARRRRTEMRTP